MPDRVVSIFQQWWGIMFPALLGIIGGAVRICQTDGPCTWRGRLAALAAAGFTGWLLYKLMEAAGVPGEYIVPVATIAGYVGRPLLDILSSRLCTIAKTTK